MRKKIFAIIMSAFLFSSMASCGGTTSDDPSQTVNPSDYETDGKFITIADLPPNPFSSDALDLYCDLGLNTMILTEDSATFTQNGKITENYKQAIRNIGEKGLNVWIRNMYNDADYFVNNGENATAERSNYGTPYTMEARNITTELSEFSEITGYYMSDEPFMTSDLSLDRYGKVYASMDQYEKLVEWKNTYAPDAYWHMNHVPSASYDHWPSNYTYKDFFQYYVDNIVSKIDAGCGRSICLDNYPFSELNPERISDSYLVDILTGATVTRDYNETADEGKEATFGICLQVFKNTSPSQMLRYPETVEDVTFQMYTGMACGARLFEYFCYRTLEAANVYGLIDANGNVTEAWDIVKQANEKALGFQKILCGFDWYNLITSSASDAELSDSEISFAAAQSMLKEETGMLKSVESRYDAIVGCFKQGGTDGYMAVNYAVPEKKQSNTVKFDFGNCNNVIVYRSGKTSVEKLLSGKYQTTLAAGEGIFLIPIA